VAYQVFKRHADPIATTKESPALLKPDPSWRMQLEEFVAAIREDREPESNGFDGLQAVRMAQAVYRSAACGEVQPIETQAAPAALVSSV
jgi:hypothetical protein